MADERPPLQRDSDAWVSWFKPWLRKRIEKLRDELETPGVDPAELRGRIAELRDLILTVEPHLPEEGTSGPYFPPGDKPS
jgi:hypothetical protein